MSCKNVMSYRTGRMELIIYFLIAAVLTPAAGWAAGSCDGLALPLDGKVLSHVSKRGERECFTAELPTAGLWLLEVDADAAAAHVELRGRCGAAGNEGFAYRERRAAGLLVDVSEAGGFEVCVGAQDPARELGSFTLTSGFVEVAVDHDGDPTETEPDPDEAHAGDASWTTKDGDPTETEPDPDEARFGDAFGDVCRLLLADDHADVLRCSTSLAVGASAAGEIDSSWDNDTFTFVLDELGTVRLTTVGDTDTKVRLYDAWGQLLDQDDDAGAEGNFRLVRTLGPGRYVVRVAGRDAGAYRLRIDSLDR